MLQIVQVPCRADNYGFLTRDTASGQVACIDTPDADEILRQLDLRQWPLHLILNTHWHDDHAGGNAALKVATGARIVAPLGDAPKIAAYDDTVADGAAVQLGATTFKVIACPGHTHGHIIYHAADARIAFVGDVLFVMGCGRVFEGTMEQMFASLQAIASLPEDTTLYCAHEYSATNARFALSQFPDESAIQARAAEIFVLREQGLPTVPTTVAAECLSNPFVRARDAEAFADLRRAKDMF